MSEREGQIDFFKDFRIDLDEALIENTDGVWRGNLLEFKLNINNINKTLFQAIKYLSKMRVKGISVPANILLISLNDQVCYYFKSQDYFDEIHQLYFGAASKHNDNFIAKKELEKIDYSHILGQAKILKLLKSDEYMKVKIDENCIVGWAERYYRENPNAQKGDFLGDTEGKIKIIGEIREPKHFKDFILPYTGKTNEKFKYLMDKLNDNLKKKQLGAFYTPTLYCEKSAELLREAIKRIPDGNDYIILDRCAGTGNLESVLTDEELEHCILSTYEYYEYKVLCERLGDKVRHIIPPIETDETYDRVFVKSADALSKEYIENPLLKEYIDNEKCTIILFENPPYAEANGSTKISSFKDSYAAIRMSDEVDGQLSNDLANVFIWSGFKYYLRQPTDSYVVFSPAKYWKSQHLINKVFGGGFAFNRKHFHTKIEACIMVALWFNEPDDTTEITLQSFNIKDNNLFQEDDLSIRRIFSPLSEEYYDKRTFSDDEKKGIICALNGTEYVKEKGARVKPIWNKNIIGFMVANSTGFDNPDLNSGLTVAGRYDGNGFYLRNDNFLEKMPLFAASRYITYSPYWTERGRIMKSGDGKEAFIKDLKTKETQQMLLKILLFCVLENQNHIRSLYGSDGVFYRNELCLDDTNGETVATQALKKLVVGEKEQQLLSLWDKILEESKKTLNYNSELTYGVYQIQKELNTSFKDEFGKKVFHYPDLNGDIKTLKTLIKSYYLEEIVPFLFKYEFLK